MSHEWSNICVSLLNVVFAENGHRITNPHQTTCFASSGVLIMFLNHWYKDILRNINRQWEVGLLVAYGKEYAPGKGGVLLSSLSHHLQKSLGARVFLQKWLRLSHFLTAYYSKCSYAFNKMVIFCHSSALVNVLFLWGNAQHLSVIPVSYIMTKYHILTFCYAQWGEIINQHIYMHICLKICGGPNASFLNLYSLRTVTTAKITVNCFRS